MRNAINTSNGGQVDQLSVNDINHATKEAGYSSNYFYLCPDLRCVKVAFDGGEHWLFDEDDCNHDIEDKLRKAQVIKKYNKTDTEYSMFHIYSSKKSSIVKFIERANAYFLKKAELMIDAKNY